MDIRREQRKDAGTAEIVTVAMGLLAEFGYDRAVQHFRQENVPKDLADHFLLIRFNRRNVAAGGQRALGVFACTDRSTKE